jgi:glycosyltransferase involved in cell wall biosynthesis
MQELKPFISIIVPSYNRADLIANTLKSLQQQEYDHYEIIVVDDGSTDNTEEIVRDIADYRTKYYKKQNAERAAARNYGAQKANGQYVNFFDSDDIALPNHLSEAVKMIRKHHQPEWFHLGYAWATPEAKVFREVNNYQGPTLNHLIPNGNPLSCNGVFIRKDVITSLPFNEDRALSASEDYELWVRMAARFPLYYDNTVTSWVIDHEDRSVRRINGEKLIKRLELLVHYLKQDALTVDTFKKDFNKVVADAYSYVALHLADDPKFKAKSIRFLRDAIWVNPGLIKNKRFYAIIKNLLIKWQGS